jgi:hypothetical protein
MYRHDQIGWLMIIVVGAAAILTGVLWILHGESVNGVTCIILLVLIPFFYRLQVIAEETELRIKFGIGLIKTSFRWQDIEACRAVRNKWYFGWGVRKIDKGWMYNISGLDAVEISMKNGRAYRIGTDEPEKLCNAIQLHLNK